MLQIEGLEVSYGDLIASYLQQLVEDGLLSYQEGQYAVTKSGRKQVNTDLQHLEKTPARLVLIEQYMLERHGLTVTEER